MTTLFQGQTSQEIYVMMSTSPHMFALSKSTTPDWHQQLEHPSQNLFCYLIFKNNRNVSNISTLDCISCCFNKSHRLPFSKSTICSTKPLQNIYNLWSSPVHSHHDYKYYVIFIDHFTKYIWLYPLKLKLNVK